MKNLLNSNFIQQEKPKNDAKKDIKDYMSNKYKSDISLLVTVILFLLAIVIGQFIPYTVSNNDYSVKSTSSATGKTITLTMKEDIEILRITVLDYSINKTVIYTYEDIKYNEVLPIVIETEDSIISITGEKNIFNSNIFIISLCFVGVGVFVAGVLMLYHNIEYNKAKNQ